MTEREEVFAEVRAFRKKRAQEFFKFRKSLGFSREKMAAWIESFYKAEKWVSENITASKIRNWEERAGFLPFRVLLILDRQGFLHCWPNSAVQRKKGWRK